MARQDYQPPPQYPDLERMVQQRRLGYLDEQALLRTLNQQRMLSGQQPVRSIEEAIGAPPRQVTQTEVAPVQLDPKAFAGRGVSTQATTAPQDSSVGSAFTGLGENLFRPPQQPQPPGVPLPRPRPPGAPGPGAPSMTTPTSNQYLAAKRAGFAQELQDPATRKYLGALLHAENIGAGPAVVESLFNRAELINESRARQGQRPLSLMQMMQGGFYGPVNRGEMPAHLARMNDPTRAARANQAIDQALAGSNTIASHTDQGSRGDPNYLRGGIGINIAGERFNDYGVRGAQEWRMRRQSEIDAAGGAAAQPAPSGAVPYTGPVVPRELRPPAPQLPFQPPQGPSLQPLPPERPPQAPQPFGQGNLAPIPWTQMQPWGWGAKPPDEPPGGGPSISGEGFANFKFGGD